MKVTKSVDDVKRFNTNKSIGNRGCDVCPNCGERSDYFDNLCSGKKTGGIMDTGARTWANGFFKTRYWKADTYKCMTCGCEWESDPYEYM